MSNDRDVKQPIWIKNDYSDVKKRGKAHCSVCYRDISGQGRMNYCPHCGQALDWENILRN